MSDANTESMIESMICAAYDDMARADGATSRLNKAKEWAENIVKRVQAQSEGNTKERIERALDEGYDQALRDHGFIEGQS